MVSQYKCMSTSNQFRILSSPTILGPVSEIPNCAGCSAADLLKDAVLPVTVQSCNNGMKAQVVDAFEPHVSAKICSPQQLGTVNFVIYFHKFIESLSCFEYIVV